jgi:RNA polymerase sigma-70 factor (ECF subfamily)
MLKLTDLTDDELVKCYVNGNNSAFDVLLQRHKSKLFSYILCSVQNEELADDIFQETFVKVIIKLKKGSYVDTGKFSAWLNRVAHNAIIDHFRHLKVENCVSTDYNEFGPQYRADLYEDSIEDSIINKQIIADLKQLIEELPQLQKEVLMMRFYNNMDYKEISQVTGVSINTALGRMRYAILNLRRIAKKKNITLTA